MRRRLVRGDGFPRWVRVLGALAGVLALVAMSLELPPGSSVPVAHAADSCGSPLTVCHTFVGGRDAKGQQKTYNGKVTVSQTQNLQPRQVLNVSWSGFEPSRSYYEGDASGELNPTEFPVVVVQCWGTDTPEKPMEPTHCQGYPMGLNGGRHLRDPFMLPLTNDPDRQGGPVNPTDLTVTKLAYGIPDTLGFTAFDGTHYTMEEDRVRGRMTIPPSMQYSGDAIPFNALLTHTDSSGSRSNVGFEVRGKTDFPELGCAFQPSPSAPGACTLEVIPIVQPWCNPKPTINLPRYPPSVIDRVIAQQLRLCKGGPRNGVGPGIAAGNQYLSAETWWLTTQWEHRFAFPLSMAVQPGDCAVVDQRPTALVSGSEAATVLMGSWRGEFCLDPRKAFKLSHTAIPEDTARRGLVANEGGTDAAFTSLPVTGSPRPVVHAPVGVTGWTVAYGLDQHPNDKGEPGPPYTDLTLSPLLLAKLLTSSYRFGTGHEPALAGNPNGLWNDPEFIALNPTFRPVGGTDDQNAQVGFPQVVWVSPSPSDSFAAMFAYVDADPEARAWLNGKPDVYSGMVVNPAYRGLPAPQMAIQYLDNWVYQSPLDRGTFGPCEHKTPMPWVQEVAQTAASLDATALAVINRKPPYLECGGTGQGDDPFHWSVNKKSSGRTGRQVIAFTTVPLAEKYGLSVARLQSHVPMAKSVAPSGWEHYASSYDTFEAALGYTKQDKATGVVSPDFSVFPFNGAYAGVLPIYAAVPTSGLDSATANNYADLLEYAAGPGQTPGTGRGQLPPGYSPLPQAYRAYTLEAARHVRAQDGVVPAPPGDLGGQVRTQLGLPAPDSPAAGSGNLGTGLAGPSGAVPSGSAGTGPAAAAAPSASAAPSKRVGALGATRGSDSWLAGWGLALLVGIGLVSGLAVLLVQVAAQPEHPLRRFFAGVADHTSKPFRQPRKPRN